MISKGGRLANLLHNFLFSDDPILYMVTHRSHGMHSVDIYEEDYEFLSEFKRLDKEDSKDFSNIADVVSEMIRGYYLHVVENQSPTPRDKDGKIILKDF